MVLPLAFFNGDVSSSGVYAVSRQKSFLRVMLPSGSIYFYSQQKQSACIDDLFLLARLIPIPLTLITEEKEHTPSTAQKDRSGCFESQKPNHAYTE